MSVTQIESCACGALHAVSTTWPKDAANAVASFRDAHKMCREPKFEVRTVEDDDIIHEWKKIDHGPVYAMPATERVDLPPMTEFVPQDVCPKCGHSATGIPVCDVVVGEDRHYCGCVYRWHSEKPT